MNNALINKTFYSEYFDEDVEGIYLVDKDEASKFWSIHIDKEANTFFKLSDDNLIIFNSRNIGNWREYYDADNFLGLQNFLSSIIDWKKEESVFFVLIREQLLRLIMKYF